MILRSLAALLLASSVSVGVFAHGPDCDTIVTTNMTPKWAWITVYDFTQGFNLDSGWDGRPSAHEPGNRDCIRALESTTCVSR